MEDSGRVLIERPRGIETVAVDLKFNLQQFEYLEVDLGYVNKNGRSNFSLREVA